MKILITGSFGNIGVSTIEKHQIRCLDIKNPVNEKRAAGYAGKIEVIWGDIKNADHVQKALEGAKNFYIDWLDTTEAQEILHFQNHSFDDYLHEMIKKLGFKKRLAQIFSPFAKMYL